MIAVVHPTGNANVRALVRSLESAGESFRLFTTIACSTAGALVRRLPSGLRNEFARRDYGIPADRIRTQPLREMVRLMAKRLKWESVIGHETGWACVDAVYRALDRRVARCIRADSNGCFSVVHAYEDGALESFRAARQRQIRCSYELPIAYWETSRNLLREEAERWPDWEPTLIGTRDSEAKFERKTEELELADLVVCPSRFVWNTLPLAIRRGKRCIVVPFGSPKCMQPTRVQKRPPAFRVLFVGSMTQRKGLADLFSAVQLLNRSDVELVVMGSLIQPLEFYQARCKKFTYERPRSHSEVLALMQSCDVLVLPSIVEGRALVQQEALSCGLPLIVTENAGGEDLIEEGRTGFLVPIRNPQKIAERIDWLAAHREYLPEMAGHARRKAASLTWSQYGETIQRALVRPEFENKSSAEPVARELIELAESKA